ncbi:MAG: hypothetical protein P8Y97_11365, partial [Candidatus Lokiarchaeota archaeon]
SFNGFRDLTVFQGQELLNRIKSASLMKCVDYFKSEILSDYTTELFNEFVRLNPSTINSRQLISVLDTLSHIDQFHREEKVQADLDISTENGILDINSFIHDIWGKSYTELLVESVRIDKFFDLNLMTEIYNKFGYHIDEKMLIGITRPLQILDIDGNRMNNFGPIWIDVGAENYDRTHSGNGFEHVIQEHSNDFNDYRSDLKTSKDINNFLFKIINMQTGVIVEQNDWQYKIAYRLLDQDGDVRLDQNGNPQFFSFILWKNENNKIHTAFPYFPQYNPNLNILFNNLGI